MPELVELSVEMEDTVGDGEGDVLEDKEDDWTTGPCETFGGSSKEQAWPK